MADVPRFSDMGMHDGDRRPAEGELLDPPGLHNAPEVVVQGRTFEKDSPVAYLMALLQSPPDADYSPEQRLMHERMRLEAAKTVAPFIHPRLAQIDHSGRVAVSHEDALDALK